MDARPLQSVIVCHSNKLLLSMGKLQAERHGVRVRIAKNGDDVLKKALEEPPDLIVLSNDLKNPSTEETVKRLDADPRLAGVRVVVVKGAIPNLRDMLGKFPGVPWQRDVA